MKKIAQIILAGMLAVLSVSCERELMEYQGGESIYFASSTVVVYTFVITADDQTTIPITVNCTGEAQPYDRWVRITIDPRRTTAVEGVHFQPLEEKYLFPAGAYSATIPIVLFNRDKESTGGSGIMQRENITIRLNMLSSDDFTLGATNRRTAEISFNDVITKPVSWEQIYRYSASYFGPYYVTKLRIFYQLFKRQFPSYNEVVLSGQGSGIWYYGYCRTLSHYFRDNEVYDEVTGERIMHWMN